MYNYENVTNDRVNKINIYKCLFTYIIIIWRFVPRFSIKEIQKLRSQRPPIFIHINAKYTAQYFDNLICLHVFLYQKSTPTLDSDPRFSICTRIRLSM